MQEAYRPLCSKYSLCCPNWVPPHQGTPLARVPPRPGYPPARIPPSQGTPPWLDLAGYPPLAGPGRVPPWLPHGILGNVAKHYGIWVPPLWTDRRTDTCQNITFPRTMYAGGNKYLDPVYFHNSVFAVMSKAGIKPQTCCFSNQVLNSRERGQEECVEQRSWHE